jgi:hypothetical protein
MHGLIAIIIWFTFISSIICTSKELETSLFSHEVAVNRLSMRVKNRRGRRLALQRTPAESHCPRPHAYKENALKLDVSRLVKVIGVDKVCPSTRLCPTGNVLPFAQQNSCPTSD